MSKVTTTPLTGRNLDIWAEHVGLSRADDENIIDFRFRIRAKLNANKDRVQVEIAGMLFWCEVPKPGKLIFFGMKDIGLIRELFDKHADFPIYRPSTNWRAIGRFIGHDIQIQADKETAMTVDMVWRMNE